MTPGRKIIELREKKDMNQTEFAKAVEMNRSVINRIEQGTRPLRDDELKKIADYFHVPADEILGRDDPITFVGIRNETSPSSGHRIPVLGSIAAGIPIEAIEDVIDWEEIPSDWLRGGAEYFALKIKGGSMEPRMFDGDVVIVRKQPTVETGQIAAVLINGEQATVKKLTISPEGVMLIGLNPSVYEPRFYSNAEVQSLPLTVLGLVVEVRGKLA